MKSKIIVVSTGHANTPIDLVERCYNSIASQGFTNVVTTMIIDKARIGKLANFVNTIAGAKPEMDDIICDVDLDDYLLPGAFDVVMKAYCDNPDLLLTYGSYVTSSGKPARFNGKYKTDSFRTQKWKASHLKSFKYKLYRQIKLRDLKGSDGNFFMTTSDMALMFSMMEMAGLDRIRHITESLYCYNDESPLSDHNINADIQKRNEIYIRRQPRRQRIETF